MYHETFARGVDMLDPVICVGEAMDYSKRSSPRLVQFSVTATLRHRRVKPYQIAFCKWFSVHSPVIQGFLSSELVAHASAHFLVRPFEDFAQL